MRKLKLQVQITIDGFMAGTNGEMDWMTFNWDEDLNNYVRRLTEPVDCILLGRKLAEGFIPHWAARPANEDADGVDKMNNTPKVVFTRTMQQSPWENATLANGDLAAEVTRLKAQAGSDIIAYGGATFVQSLVQHGLVDEYHLFVNPAAIGSGLPVFKNLEAKLALQLVHATPFPCGVVVLQYAPANK